MYSGLGFYLKFYGKQTGRLTGHNTPFTYRGRVKLEGVLVVKGHSRSSILTTPYAFSIPVGSDTFEFREDFRSDSLGYYAT